MAEWHRVGQQVVCVDMTWQSDLGVKPCPQKGQIYTITHVGCDDGDDNGVYFCFAEINSFKFWYAWHFRPVKKTDISVFTAMLAPTPKKKVLEDA